jgi:protein gp37
MLVQRSKTNFNAPLKWAEPKIIFTCSWSDWFIDEADNWRDEAWDIIKRTPQHTYQILTKRPERVKDHLPADWGEGYSNVWLGVSVESQKYANERIPLLLDVPAKVRFLSCEPLLGEVYLSSYLIGCSCCGAIRNLDSGWRYNGYGWEHKCPDNIPQAGHFESEVKIQWVITGGESGSKENTRHAELDWFRSIRNECKAEGVAYFHKQHGGSSRVDGHWGGRLLDGVEHNEMPEVSE